MVRKQAVFSVLIVIVLLMSGCAVVLLGAAAGGAGVVWYEGWLTDQVNGSVRETFDASRAGLKELDMPIYKERFDSVKGSMKSTLSDGKDVSIKFKATTGSTTEIKIRVGIMGNKQVSYRVLNAIKQNM